MSWALVIVIFVGPGLTMSEVDFSTLQRCKAAIEQISSDAKRTGVARVISATCVKK